MRGEGAAGRIQVAVVTEALPTHQIVCEPAFNDVEPMYLANGVARCIGVKEAADHDKNLLQPRPLLGGDELGVDVMEPWRTREAVLFQHQLECARALPAPAVLRKVDLQYARLCLPSKDDERARDQLTVIRHSQRLCSGSAGYSSEPATRAESNRLVGRAAHAVCETQSRESECNGCAST